MSIRTTGLWITEACAIAAAIIGFLAIQTPGPIQMMLFLWGVAALVVFGSVLYLVMAITDYLGRRGATMVRFPPGETIFKEGDEGDFVYKIDDGEVEVVRKDESGQEKEIARLGAGDVFGEAALLSDAPRNATVRTLSAVHAVKIGRDDFATLYAHMPDFRRRVETIKNSR